MRTKFLLLLAIPVAIAALIYGYTRMSQEQEADEDADQPIASASHVRREPNGETVVTLDQKTQHLIGLQTAALPASALPPEIQAYGRVLDPTPLVEAFSEVASARAALGASSREYQRLKALAQNQNTSAKALETAKVAMEQDRIALQAARARLRAGWGSSLAEEPDLSAFVQSLAKLNQVLVRLDLPTGETARPTPRGARLPLPGTSEPIPARYLSPAPTTDPQVQGEGFMFVVTNAPTRLTPGLALAGFLELPGDTSAGVVVPDSAVVRSAERAWIYLQNDETNFIRRAVALDHPVSGGWFVTNNIAPGDRVVVAGAQMLLSEEGKTQIKVED